MGPKYFPSLFLCVELFLKQWLPQGAYICVRLHWPTTIKIDSDGIWWLTHCLSPEKKKGKNNIRKKAQGLTHTHQLHARVSSNASAIRKITWVKMEGGKWTLKYIYSVRLLLKHTWLKKTDIATCMLPLIILLTSLLDLKATGPLPKKQRELGQRVSWQLSDGLLAKSTTRYIQRLTVHCPNLLIIWNCSYSTLAKWGYSDIKLIIVIPCFLLS